MWLGRALPSLLWLSTWVGGSVSKGKRADRSEVNQQSSHHWKKGQERVDGSIWPLANFRAAPGAHQCLWQQEKKFKLICTLIPGAVSSSEKKRQEDKHFRPCLWLSCEPVISLIDVDMEAGWSGPVLSSYVIIITHAGISITALK